VVSPMQLMIEVAMAATATAEDAQCIWGCSSNLTLTATGSCEQPITKPPAEAGKPRQQVLSLHCPRP
jgi:hypothetical protein